MCVEFPIQIANKWQHRQLMNEYCPHIFGKRYFCGIKFKTFFKISWIKVEPQRTWNSNRELHVVILFYGTVACRCNYLPNG